MTLLSPFTAVHDHFGKIGTGALAVVPIGLALPPVESMAYFLGVGSIALGSAWVVLAGKRAEAARKAAVEKASSEAEVLLIKARAEAELLLVKARTSAALLLIEGHKAVSEATAAAAAVAVAASDHPVPVPPVSV